MIMRDSIERTTLGLSAAITLLAALGGCTTNQATRPVNTTAVETYVKGVYAYQGGKQDEAVSTLKDAIANNPQLIMPRVLLGSIYKQRNDYAAAAEQYETLVQLDPYNKGNFYQLGVSYQLLQRLREAADAYRKTLRLDDNDFGANMNLGLVYLTLGDVDNAIRFTQKAAALRPESAEAQANLAIVLDSAGQYAPAEKAYRKSLELAPLQSGTLTNYGNNLIAQQKWSQAVEVFNEILKRDNTPYLHKRLADAYALGGKYDQAIAEYKTALKKNPKYFAALNEQARVMILQYQRGMELDDIQRDQALAIWRQSLEVQPDQPKIKLALQDWEKRMFSK